MTDTHLIFLVLYRIWALVLSPNGSFLFAEKIPPNGQVMFQIQRLLTYGKALGKPKDQGTIFRVRWFGVRAQEQNACLECVKRSVCRTNQEKGIRNFNKTLVKWKETRGC